MLGAINWMIGFGYNPKKNNTAMITTKTIPSLIVISAKGLVLVSPNITDWYIFNIQQAPKMIVVPPKMANTIFTCDKLYNTVNSPMKLKVVGNATDAKTISKNNEAN